MLRLADTLLSFTKFRIKAHLKCWAPFKEAKTKEMGEWLQDILGLARGVRSPSTEVNRSTISAPAALKRWKLQSWGGPSSQ